MFESATNPSCDIAVFDQDEQQKNGPICQLDQAMFLAKFLIKLVLRYNKMSDSASLNRKVFKKALTETLLSQSVEDMNSFSCLLMLKERLVSLIESQDRLDIKTLALFQLKDFCRQDKEVKQQFEQNLEAVKISSKSAIMAMDNR